MIIIMVAAFLFAWMPYAVVSLIVVFGGDALINPSAAAVPAIFAKSSIVYNPIIYVLANPQVSSAFFFVSWHPSYEPLWSTREARSVSVSNKQIVYLL
nr:ciliary opsin [Macrobiotus polonicus]